MDNNNHRYIARILLNGVEVERFGNDDLDKLIARLQVKITEEHTSSEGEIIDTTTGSPVRRCRHSPPE